MIATETNVQGLLSTMVEFAAATGRAIKTVMPEQVALFVRDVVKLTPPFQSFSVGESFAAQRKVGELAVSLDIQKVFKPIESLRTYEGSGRFAANFRSAVDNNRGDVIEILMKRSLANGGVASDLAETARNSVKKLDPDHHSRMRNRRGRVRRNPQRELVLQVELTRFIKKKIKNVGIMKGGWCAAAFKYGVKLPAWITRHARGQVIEDLSGNNPSITIRNDAPAIAVQNQELRITTEAMKRRATAMARQIDAKLGGRF